MCGLNLDMTTARIEVLSFASWHRSVFCRLSAQSFAVHELGSLLSPQTGALLFGVLLRSTFFARVEGAATYAFLALLI